LVDISLTHRRAEVLIGIVPEAPLGLSAAAMLMLFQFYYRAMGFNKLYSQVYSDNPHSLKSTLHLGFTVEGVLREHVRDPRTGKFIDLSQTSLLAKEAFSEKNEKLMRRLLA
jgi:RimJ/RimL family protein N-acetyltransferase